MLPFFFSSKLCTSALSFTVIIVVVGLGIYFLHGCAVEQFEHILSISFRKLNNFQDGSFIELVLFLSRPCACKVVVYDTALSLMFATGAG